MDIQEKEGTLKLKEWKALVRKLREEQLIRREQVELERKIIYLSPEPPEPQPKGRDFYPGHPTATPDPTREEIRAACLEIRKTWSFGELQRRKMGLSELYEELNTGDTKP